jgi:hypothetical protein
MWFLFQSRSLYEDRQKKRHKVVCGAKNNFTFATPKENRVFYWRDGRVVECGSLENY